MRNERVDAVLRADPEVARAVDEVDLTLVRASLRRTPMERLRHATAHLRALRKFKRASPEGS